MRGTGIDLPEALPSPSPPSSSSHFSPGRHYYVAVDRLQFKMETLVDLLGVAGRRPSLPMVICCSSRDELDAVCASVSNLSFISLSSLYSDLAESERALVLEKFHQSTAEWSQINNARPGDDLECGNVAQKSCMVVVTDASLPLVASGEAPLLARILINYELPTKKDLAGLLGGWSRSGRSTEREHKVAESDYHGIKKKTSLQPILPDTAGLTQPLIGDQN